LSTAKIAKAQKVMLQKYLYKLHVYTVPEYEHGTLNVGKSRFLNTMTKAAQ